MNDLETLLKKNICWTLSGKVDELCHVFLDNFGINYFDCSRFYKDSTFFSLFNDKNYLLYILKNGKAKKHTEYKPPTCFLHPGSYIWSTYIDPNFLSEANKNFKHYHGVTIIKSGELYDEVINFSAPYECFDVLDIYQRHQMVLEYFSTTIVSEFSKVIENPNNRPVLPSQYIPKKYDKNLDLKIDNFFKKILSRNKVKNNQILLPVNGMLITISKTEFVCLQILVKGLSNKEIAKEMGISPRTVDTLLERMMRKTQTSNRLALVNALPKMLLEKLKY